MKQAADSALLTDLYQLTMLQAYYDEGLDGSAVFELFVRALPAQRNFLLLAGIEQALTFLEQLSFDPGELDWLRATGRFRTDFLDWLSELRFTGEVHAMREGTIFFVNEPVLRVEAPIAQAQLVESRLLNLIHYATLVASKAARCRLAAPDSLLVDFGLRRAHGAEAGLVAARSSYLASFAGSATVLAGQHYGIPVFGTMAHSYVEVHELEVQAFRAYADSLTGLRGPLMLLIDTYDTEAAARKIVALAPALERRGARIASVRLDSGDLAAHARLVRTILDQGGLREVSIFASGKLDERRLQQLLQAGAPIDGFGVGTALSTSADAPALDAVYKLQSYAGKPRRKRSEGKATWPGAKQVWRCSGPDGRPERDLVALADEAAPAGGLALLQPVMRAGRRIVPPEALPALREHAAAQLAALPNPLRGLDSVAAAQAYPVAISDPLQQLAISLDRLSH